MTAEDVFSPGGNERAQAAAPLVVRVQGTTRTLEPGPVYRIGRDPAADIVVEEPLVSWRHAVLTAAPAGWLLEDSGSTNGTFADGARVQRVEITAPRTVRLGHPQAGTLLSCSPAGRPATVPARPPPTAVLAAKHPLTLADKAPTGVVRLPDKVLRIGRAADSDVVVPDLRVSRHHAELRKRPAGSYEITDLGVTTARSLTDRRSAARSSPKPT